jgi:hypothetical protein
MDTAPIGYLELYVSDIYLEDQATGFCETLGRIYKTTRPNISEV